MRSSLGLFFMVLLILSGNVLADNQYQYIPNSCSKVQPLKGDEYWPWSLAIPFPWKDIHGLWRAEYADGSESYFAFSVVRRDSESKQLKVVQYSDLETCSILARGVGQEYDKQINAQMIAKKDGLTFRILMAAFDASSLPKAESCTGPVMAMSLIPFNPRILSRSVNMPLFKFANRVTCKPASAR